MVSVSKTGGVRPYQVRWRDESGRQRKQSFARKLDADRFKAKLEHDLHTGAYVDPSAGRVTLREYAEQWRGMQPWRPRTAERTESLLYRHVYPALGDRQINAVRPSEIQAFVAGLSATLKPGTVRLVFTTVRAIFAAAARDRLIGYDPCQRIKLPEVHRPEVQPLTVVQVEALASAIVDRYRALVVVAAGTGMRQGELFGLQVADIDFLRRTIKVQRQVQPKRGGGYLVGPPKNRSSLRTVPVGNVVVNALAEHLRKYPASGDEFVFRFESGGPCTRNMFNGGPWDRARRAAGLPGVGMHELRHFYASALIRAGLSVKVVAERLGHANAAMTLNVYSHLWPDDSDRTRQAIDELLAPDVRPIREVI